MRILVFFDLPSVTLDEKREYSRFRKFLIKSGFMMLQESVYCKLALNKTVSDGIVNSLRNNKPNDGLVQVLVITEKQFSKIEFIAGERKREIIDSDERLVIL